MEDIKIISDEKLAELYADGNESAFAVLIERHLPAVCGFARKYVGDADKAEDIAQETFVKVWKNIKTFDTKRNLRSWLFTIAKNTALDYLKKKKVLPFANFTSDEGYNPFEEIPEDKILPDELLEQKDAAKQLEEKLEKIPEQYRIILTMRYMDDLTLHEIADVLDLPYNTIKSQHGRALQSLKNIFDKTSDVSN